jgi:membrane protein DedA with SNARE-associated domain
MDTITDLFERFGVAIVFVNTLLHELGVPLPLTPTVLMAGAASSQFAAIASLVASVVAGSLIGNAVWFAAGRRFGGRVLARRSLDSYVGRTGYSFERWGATLVVAGRFIPGVSLVAPPIAGALGMSWSRFMLLSALGAMLWASVIIVLGAMLQDVLAALVDALAAFPIGAWIALLALPALYIAWRAMKRRRTRRAVATSPLNSWRPRDESNVRPAP